MGLNSQIRRGNVIEALQQRVEQLIADHQRLADRNRELTQQCDQQLSQRRQLQSEVAKLKRQLALTTITSTIEGGREMELSEQEVSDEGVKDEGVSDEGVSEEYGGELGGEAQRGARAYINALLREVDECIALVSLPLEQRCNSSENQSDERQE